MNIALPTWLLLALPPLLGAIIGYVTNALAIRMLFRPLTKKYFLGIPIPLTPGIIPRQRDNLAHNIARMVSNSLFNAEVINSHIRGEGFQRALRLQISELVSPRRERGQAEVAAPEGAEDDPRSYIRSRVEQIEDLISPIFDAPVTRKLLKNIFRRVGRDLGSRRLGDFLPITARNQQELEAFLDGQIRGESFRRLKWALLTWLKTRSEENTPVADFLSATTLRRGIHIIDRLYPPAVNFLMDFLRRPDIRRELVKRGKVILSDILMRLNPVQRIVVSAGQYDRTLEENIPDIIRDLLRTLEKSLRAVENRQKIITALHEFLSGFQKQGVGDLEREYGLSFHRSLHRILEGFQELLIRESAAARLAEYFVRQTSGENSPDLDELLQRYTRMNFGDILNRLYSLIFLWIDDEEKRKRLRSDIVEMLLRARTPGPPDVPRGIGPGAVADAVPSSPGSSAEAGAGPETSDENQSDEMVEAVSNGISILIEGAVPSLVERFNIYQMVVDRINALSMEDVEQLLLGIIARHLKYINIFGAILGALIGGAQLFLRVIS